LSAGEDEPGGELGEPPEADALARAVRKSRVAKNLFAVDEPVRIGRYQLLERVGAGGIGVVWGAWDPELERRVAIKLIKPTLAAARERILAEGQALAKLSHPHVVPVFDVGVYEDQVYLVMEWVRGKTLRAWSAEARPVREIVGVYRAAGAGLAAAHAAGLVHRDFKPDNAIVGDDGRVRVLDFGLARGEARDDGEASSGGTRGAGTPRYMAPEQVAGGPLTAAADQYAFCVSLREALEKQGPVPRWLVEILAHGTASDPGERFASFDDLLATLARDPATVWRRRFIAGGVVAFVAVAFVAGGLRSRRVAVTPCEGAAEDIARTWNPAVRARVLAHVRSLGAYGAAEAESIAKSLDDYGARWATTHRDACLAHERREITDVVYDRQLGCMARALVGWRTLAAALEGATDDRLGSITGEVHSLPAVAGCELEAHSSTTIPPDPRIAMQAARVGAEVEQARVLAKTHDPQAEAVTRLALEHATALGYPPLIARAELADGIAHLAAEHYETTLPALDRAALAALDAFDDPTFVEARARAIFVRSMIDQLQPPGDEDVLVRVASRSGEAGAFARTLLYNNLGALAKVRGELPLARSWFDRAIAQPNVRTDSELVGVYGNRALITDDPTERDHYLAEGSEVLTKMLGPLHRQTLDLRIQGAFLIADADRAEPIIRELCDQYRAYHASSAQITITGCTYELGWLAWLRGDASRGAEAFSTLPQQPPLDRLSTAFQTALRGDYVAAARDARQLAQELTPGSARMFGADAYLLAARCELAASRQADAAEDARRALEIIEQFKQRARLGSYQRRLALARSLTAAVSH
jgi:hypothetical protein